jgi:hypothetical protein
LKKPIAFYDTECFPNYWLLKLRPQGCPTSFAWTAPLSDLAKMQIHTLFAAHRTISFNGIGYDVAMIGAALAGYTPEQLKEVNDMLIGGGVKHWQLKISDWQPLDHVDLMEVAPGTGSLKQYGGRLHTKKMQDLPYEPSRILTADEIVAVAQYCDNDIGVLEDLYNALLPQVTLRDEMCKRYGLDLMSKSDAQIAQAVLKHKCEQGLGKRVYKADIDYGLQFKFQPASWIQFQLPQLQEVFTTVCESIFTLDDRGRVTMPESLEGLEVTIGNTTYRMGIGGLHSKDKPGSHYNLVDADVASYYPSLILNSGKFPAALGETFISAYSAIKTERIEAKHSGNTTVDACLKIVLNSSFGHLNNPYSILFAPEMFIQTTLSGQLALLMLIEWYELCGIKIVSANTDGILLEDGIYTSGVLIKQWEALTGLEMECNKYKAIYMRDVNNYIAIKQDGSIKTKGIFAKTGLMKNPNVDVCSEAVVELLTRGEPIEATIFHCTDIRKFVSVRKVNGGAVKVWNEQPVKNAQVKVMRARLINRGFAGEQLDKLALTLAYYETFDQPQKEYLGKVVRFYYAKDVKGCIEYASNGNMVGKSEGAKPCMILPDSVPDDLNYDWYVTEAKQILVDIGVNT